jgi:uncharacterized protein (UPF0261 family)
MNLKEDVYETVRLYLEENDIEVTDEEFEKLALEAFKDAVKSQIK